LGEMVAVSIEVQASNAMPSDPQLGRLPPSLRLIAGPSISTSTSIQIMNGVTVAKRGITATWQLQALRTGTFTVGPPSAAIGGVRRSAAGVLVTAVDAAHAPPRRARPRPQPQNPFDPFQGLFNFGREPEPTPPSFEPQTDPKLALDAPRDRGAF